jgi:hypothetical protein
MKKRKHSTRKKNNTRHAQSHENDVETANAVLSVVDGETSVESMDAMLAAQADNARRYKAGEPVLPVPMFMPDPKDPTRPCEAVKILYRLMNEGRLSVFLDVFYDWPSEDGLGNAHEVSLLLMVDLICARQAEEWRLVRAVVRHPGQRPDEHSWLEHHGWAVDASNGRLMIIPADWYRQTCRARKIVERDTEEVRRFLKKQGWTELDEALEQRLGRHQVRIYDFNTRKATEIPADELAPGMLPAEVQGVGRVWIDPTQIKPSERQYFHPPFPPETRGKIERIAHALREVHPQSVAQWEDGFRRDLHAEWQIFLFGCTAEAYTRLTEGRDLSRPQKADLYQAVLQAPGRTHEEFMHTVPLQVISKHEALRAAEVFYSVYRQNNGPAEHRRLCPDLISDGLIHGDRKIA